MIGCSLYRFYDADGVLLYVGITSVGPERWKGHEEHRKWWARTARTTVEHYPTRDAATTAERSAIRLESPLFNVKHNRVAKEKRPAIYRKHGEGTIHQRADTGRWMVSAYVHGKRFQTTFRDEREARLFLAVLQYRDVRQPVRDRAIAVLRDGEGWSPA